MPRITPILYFLESEGADHTFFKLLPKHFRIVEGENGLYIALNSPVSLDHNRWRTLCNEISELACKKPKA